MKDIVKSTAPAASGGEKKSRQKHEQGSIVGYCAIAFVFVALIVLVLCLTVFFKVKNVEINGVSLYRNDQILGVGGIINDENLVRTDTKLIRQRLEQHLVYIESAKVTKKYPSTIIVDITEAEKAADVIADDKFCVVSKTGRVLEMGNAAATGGIPVIRGFELSSKKPGEHMQSSDPSKLKIYNDMIKILDSIGMKKITEIDLSSRSGITILYDGRITLELGSSVDLDYKLNYFKSVIDSKLTDEFRGRLVYNGADSGISAIPEGAGIKDDDSKDDTSSKTDDADKNGENGNNGGDDNNGGGNNNGGNTADPNAVPDSPANYGYMQDNDQNTQNNQNGTGYDYNNGGYDYNNGYNYNNGYDYNNGGNAYNYNNGYDYNNGGYNYNYNNGYDNNNGGYNYNYNNGYDYNNGGYNYNYNNGYDYNNGGYGY